MGHLTMSYNKSMQASYASQFKKSEICSPCHQDARILYLQPVDENDQPKGDAIERILWSEDTYQEWSFSGYSGLEEDYPVKQLFRKGIAMSGLSHERPVTRSNNR